MVNRDDAEILSIDFRERPDLADRYAVIDKASGAEIRRVAWADAATGTYATWIVRAATLRDPCGTDLRVRARDGSFALHEHQGEIAIVDTSVDPLRDEVLALLDDAKVRAKIDKMIVAAINARLGMKRTA